ncbi:MAG: phosphoglycolate phosphatase [Alphaproteobacteria bacterium]|mgnify:CR=1 FL=1
MTVSPAPRARRAVVFDLDGTLVDSAPDIHDAINAVLVEESRAQVSLSRVIGMIGDGAEQLVARAFAESGPRPEGAALRALLSRFLARYEAHPARLTKPFPGVADTLALLKREGYRLGVCTNKPDRLTTVVLAALDLAPYFDAVVGPDAVERRKPDAAHMRATLEALGASAEDATMVGDGLNDVRIAKAAGMPCVCVTFGYAHQPPSTLGADVLIDRFEELPGALARLA